MPSIEAAIKQLEASGAELKALTEQEEKATEQAIREAAKEAKAKIAAEYAERIKAARQNTKDAERKVKEAQERIRKALDTNPEPTRPRVKRGERESQFVNYVNEHPGAHLSDIARGLGLSPSTASTIAKRVVESNQVVKTAKKAYEPVPS